MYNMYLDDLRVPSTDNNWVVVRSYNEAVEYVKKNGLPSSISFDHDLGDNVKSGMDFAHFMVQYMLDNNIDIMPSYSVHSANPPGAANIKGLLDSFSNFLHNM